MRAEFKKWQIVTAAVNAAAIVGALVLTAVGASAAKSQSYNNAADRWRNGTKGEYTQISCFFSNDAGFDINSMNNLRGKLLNKLSEASVTAEPGRTLVPDGYSLRAGTAQVTCDVTGRSEAEITAVGGNFFLFRDFRLASGAFFSDRDLMQDGAVIDKRLAWSLYGSENIVGKNIYINNVQLFVSGVIETPSTEAEERCAGDVPKAYISYYAAGRIFGSELTSGRDMGMEGEQSAEVTKITCYECVVPDPVENFAYNCIKENEEETNKGKVSIVNNTERFRPKKYRKPLEKLDGYAVQKDGISYPFWENASRMVEVRLSFIYGARKLLLIIPLLTLICLVITAFRLYQRKKQDLKKAVVSFVSAKWRALRNRKENEAVKAKEKETEALAEADKRKLKIKKI